MNIRWHQTQLLSWDYAYAYVTPGLHTDFSDISLSIKWKRFLFLMLMLMLMFMSLPVYAALLKEVLVFMLVLTLMSQSKPGFTVS